MKIGDRVKLKHALIGVTAGSKGVIITIGRDNRGKDFIRVLFIPRFSWATNPVVIERFEDDEINDLIQVLPETSTSPQNPDTTSACPPSPVSKPPAAGH